MAVGARIMNGGSFSIMWLSSGTLLVIFFKTSRLKSIRKYVAVIKEGRFRTTIYLAACIMESNIGI